MTPSSYRPDPARHPLHPQHRRPMRPRLPLHLLCLLAPLLAEPALAQQVVEARDGATVLARVSRQEVTRIAFERSRVRRVTGNANEFVLEKDDERGQVFIRPADPQSTKPINLFVSSDRGTVSLLLQPVDVPGDSIVIREPRATADAPPRLEASSRHVRTLKNLLVALADDSLPEDMEVREPGRDIALWSGTRLTLERVLLGAHVVAEKYRLANTGAAALTLHEPDLHKRGVMAVSVERVSLQPGEATPVFVIRERRSDD
jgi:conjugal transfer pilus assembly protein TraK